MQRTPFKAIKNQVLGDTYDLSVAFVSVAAMRRAMKYKVTTEKKISNVLSFPLSKNSGEILLCKSAAAPYTTGFLFIHGVLHLSGLKHGATMDSAEKRLLRRFNLCKKSSPASTSVPTKLR
jgi:ssRNA-specific RNase YbeY (16S rRNA maturation enzyme)